ncbi:MAG: hypothetical protein R3A52_25035 [Polyangiales bacterium]
MTRARALLAAAALCALALVTAHFATRPLGAGDVFWMVRAGEEFLSSGAIPDREAWSFTAAGTEWNNHEWLFEALAALLHRAGGLGALRLLTLALFAAPLARVTLAAWRRLGPGWSVLAMSAGLTFASFKLIPAPQTASMAAFTFAAFAFLRRDEALTPRRAAALGATLLVWANLTAEALSFAPFLLADRALWLAPRWSDAKLRARELTLLALSTLMLAVTPPASSTIEYALTGSRVNRSVNAEFAHLWEPATTVPGFLKVLAAAVLVAWVGLAITRLRKGVTAASLRALSAGAIASAMVLLFERNLWMALLPAADLAVALRDALAEEPREGRRGALAAGVALFAAFGAAIGWSPSVTARAHDGAYYRAHVDDRTLPAACVAGPSPFPAGTKLFTSRLWASYVLYRWPGVRVFIDGRNREYPEVLHRAAVETFAGGPRAQAVLEGSGAQVVLAWPGWNAAPSVARAGWRPLRVAGNCALYAR